MVLKVLVLDLSNNTTAAPCEQWYFGSGDNALSNEVAPYGSKTVMDEINHIPQVTNANYRYGWQVELVGDSLNIVLFQPCAIDVDIEYNKVNALTSAMKAINAKTIHCSA